MSTTWASKISWILSPTRSYIACMSRFWARPSLDAVDERELGGALIGLGQQALRLVEEARVLERHAEARGQRHQQPNIGFREGVLAVQVLEGDHAARLAADDERREERRHRPARPGSTPRLAAARSPAPSSRSLTRSGSRVSRTALADTDDRRSARPGIARRARCVYGKRTRPASLSRMPMSTTWASKISRILSPTRSYIACMSRFWARPPGRC